ncbi:MAG: hypothetical protein WCV84_00010 [Patescibacteria group bacterium]
MFPTYLSKALSYFSILGCFLATGFAVQAADTQAITATVGASSVSVTVTTDGAVAYGNIPLSGSTTTIALSETQTIQNNGSDDEAFNIIGTDSLNWTLEAAVGADQYTHEFSTTTGSLWTFMAQDAYTSMDHRVASSGTSALDMRISVPSTSSSYDPQTVSVTIQAVVVN